MRAREEYLGGGRGSTPGLPALPKGNDGDDVTWRTLAERWGGASFADAARTQRIGTFYCSDDAEVLNARLNRVQSRYIRHTRESDSSLASLRHAHRPRNNSLREASGRQAGGTSRYQAGTGLRRVAPTTMLSHTSSPLTAAPTTHGNEFESGLLSVHGDARFKHTTAGATADNSPPEDGVSLVMEGPVGAPNAMEDDVFTGQHSDIRDATTGVSAVVASLCKPHYCCNVEKFQVENGMGLFF